MSLRDPHRLREIWRYYQAGIVNTAFGFGLFALFVRLGLNIFVAQILVQVVGATFNYVTYSRHVFRDAAPAKLRFAIAYLLNYLAGLVALAVAARLIRSPYGAGLAAVLAMSLINYVALKRMVFVRKSALPNGL